jgi:hypothetical protein
MTAANDQAPGAWVSSTFKYCNWCKGYASDVRVVLVVDQGSGHGQASNSACPRHRHEHGLTPLGQE